MAGRRTLRSSRSNTRDSLPYRENGYGNKPLLILILYLPASLYADPKYDQDPVCRAGTISMTVISGGARKRIGGPQVPLP